MCDMQIIYCLFLKGHLKKQVWADVHDLEIRCYTPISRTQPLSHHYNFKSYYRPQKYKFHAYRTKHPKYFKRYQDGSSKPQCPANVSSQLWPVLWAGYIKFTNVYKYKCLILYLETHVQCGYVFRTVENDKNLIILENT